MATLTPTAPTTPSYRDAAWDDYIAEHMPDLCEEPLPFDPADVDAYRERFMRPSPNLVVEVPDGLEFGVSPREQHRQQLKEQGIDPKAESKRQRAKTQQHVDAVLEQRKKYTPSRFDKLPWRLPRTLKPTEEMSLEELEAEARSEKPLLKKIGFKDSAIIHQDRVKLHYLRAAGFLGWLGIKPFILGGLWVVLGTAFAIAFFTIQASNFDFSSQTGECLEGAVCVDEADEAGVPIWAGPLLGLVVGQLVTLTSALTFLAISRFDTAYSPTTVAEARYFDRARGVGRVVLNIARIPMLRMATVTHQENRYIGDEGSASFGHGRSLVETDAHIPEVDDVRIFYDATPHLSSWTGRFASATNSWYTLAGTAGKLDRYLKNKRKEKGFKLDPVGNYGVILFLGALAFAVIMSISGFDAHNYVQENLPY